MVLDGRGLTDAQMQAFAKETNLSETTFILPRTTIECERGVRVRIFTIEEELPFAGHPTLGTAFVLRGASGAREIKLDLNVGPVPVRFKDTSGQPAFGEMTQVEIPSSGLSTIAQPHARMLFYNGEDPATGSAAGCAAAWMVANGVAQPDERVLIEQGIEMKRPSRIFVHASRGDNGVVNVRVGGNAVEVMR